MGWLAHKQFERMINEGHTLNKFWHECWQCDPHGNEWLPLKTYLKGSELDEAKAYFGWLGWFEFKVDKGEMYVRNRKCLDCEQNIGGNLR